MIIGSGGWEDVVRVSRERLGEAVRSYRAWLATETERERAQEPPPTPGAPGTGVLVALCVWAAALALSGLLVGVAALATMPAAPGWFSPTVIAVGLAGIATTAAALVAAHRPRLPWLLLGAGTAALVTVATLTSVVG